MSATLLPLLMETNAESPGRYFTPEEMEQLRAADPYLAPRLDAALEAQAKQGLIVQAAVDATLAKYEFEKRINYAREKCYRDVGYVYEYAVYAMIQNNIVLLENKLLFWMRTIIRAYGFPGGDESIRFTYAGLRQEANRRLNPDHARLLDPFLAAAERILPSK